MESRSRSFSVRMFVVVAGLLALVAGGAGAMLAQVSTAAPDGPAFRQPAYPEPQFIPAIVYQLPPTPTPPPSPTPVPPAIAVGQRNGWDGEGYVTLDSYFEVGTHTRRLFDQMVAADIIRSDNLHWYDPNPEGWEQEQWFEHYRLSTGELHSVTGANPDPRWKWGHPWFMPYAWTLRAGQDTFIDGERFAVAGPYQGATEFGAPVQYWELVNRSPVLFFDDGVIQQYVLPGELVLHFDAGQTRLLLYSDIMRRLYYGNAPLAYKVRYVNWLTVSNAFPETGRTADPSLSPPTPELRGEWPTGTTALSEGELKTLREAVAADAWLAGP